MSPNKVKTACVEMTGPDGGMDLLGSSFYDLANPLPPKCSHCTFPDFDFVAKPYLLVKGFSSPAETSMAKVGNFLIRERVRRVIELTVPGACTFHPTAEKKSKKPTPWWLAVPTRALDTFVAKPDDIRCSACGQPRYWLAFNGPEVSDKMKEFDSKGIDVFKSVAWMGTAVELACESENARRKAAGETLLPWSHWDITPPSHPQRWTRVQLHRNLYFSVRLEQLFKRAKVKGQMVRSSDFKDTKPSPEDEAWVEEKLRLLAEHGLVDPPKASTGKPASTAQKWFKQFLKQNTTTQTKAVDFAAVEKKHKFALPQSYKDFLSTFGPASFKDVNGMEGSTTTVLLPQKLDFKDYRRGKVPDLEGEDAEVDGVMFASTDFGDCFVFDVSVKGGDYPVYWWRHEENTLEPYTSNFAECIKRFAKRN